MSSVYEPTRGAAWARFRLWPRSLAARTALVLLAALALVQVAGLTIHALDRLDLQRLAQARDLASRIMSLYRTVVVATPAQREVMLRDVPRTGDFTASLSSAPPGGGALEPAPPALQRLLRANLNLWPIPVGLRPHEILILGGPRLGRLVAALRLPDGTWLTATY